LIFIIPFRAGIRSGSPAMNIWLHKQVMQKLAESGGRVPESLMV